MISPLEVHACKDTEQRQMQRIPFSFLFLGSWLFSYDDLQRSICVSLLQQNEFKKPVLKTLRE